MESTSYKYIHLTATTYQVRKIKKLLTRNVDGVQETVLQQSGLIPPPHHHLLAEHYSGKLFTKFIHNHNFVYCILQEPLIDGWTFNKQLLKKAILNSF